MYAFTKDSGTNVVIGSEIIAINTSVLIYANSLNKIFISTENGETTFLIGLLEIDSINGTTLTGSETIDTVIELLREVFAK